MNRDAVKDSTTATGHEPAAIATEVFTALADPTRREVLHTLVQHGAASASGLARRLPVSRQAIGKHLDALSRAELVKSHRLGREVRYEPQLAPLRHTAQWMDDLARQWQARLARLAAFAEATPRRPPRT